MRALYGLNWLTVVQQDRSGKLESYEPIVTEKP